MMPAVLFAQACVLKCKHSPTEPQRSKIHACLYLLLLLFHGSANLPDATGAAAAAMAAAEEEEGPYKPSLDWTAAPPLSVLCEITSAVMK